MDDRMTPVLQLELSPVPPEQYAVGRAQALAGRDGVGRVSWWRNAHLGRTDLPRRVRTSDGDDFPTLGVIELVGPGVPLPPATDGDVALRFERYPRPAQGRLTGKPTRGLQVVMIHPAAPDRAQALRDWGDFVHLRHIAEAACPGFTIITPYERVRAERADDMPRFLHFYEMDTDDPEPAFKAMTPLVASRLGGEETEVFKHWAWHDALVIDYVNTFAYVGEAPDPTS